MNINLIDSLLDAPPIIDREKCTIKSDIPLSNILTSFVSPNENKSELVIFSHQLDQIEYDRRTRQYVGSYYGVSRTDRYRSMWEKINPSRFIISKKLLEFLIENSRMNVIQKFFQLDCSDRNEFLRYKEAFSLIVDKFNYLKEGEAGYLIYGERGNSQIRYGKFINTLYDILCINSYYNNKNQEIEQAVDQYKSKFSISKYKVCVLNGRDLLLGYDIAYQQKYQSGMLGGSCMNDKKQYLKLYSKNPDKIYLFVITNSDDKIISRNLVWRIKKYNNFFFDRVYAIDNYIRNVAIKIAEEENWMIYVENVGLMKVKRIDIDGEVKEINNDNLKIKLSFKGVHTYPYLDSFRYQRIWSNTLTTKRVNKFRHLYEYTNGGRSTRKF